MLLIQCVAYVVGLPAAQKARGMEFASAADVFGTFQNFSDWSPGVAVPMTWFAAVWVNSGWQAPAYLAEGTHNASRVVPRSMLTSYATTAIGGLVIMLVTAFCITDMEAVAGDET
jgi:amino acid transporter